MFLGFLKAQHSSTEASESCWRGMPEGIAASGFMFLIAMCVSPLASMAAGTWQIASLASGRFCWKVYHNMTMTESFHYRSSRKNFERGLLETEYALLAE